MDNAATTRAAEPVVQLMEKVLREDYGNPSSRHQKGVEAERYVCQAKKTIAKALKCLESEIVLTSGGTESNNMALIGMAEANKRAGKHIISSCIEHASVYQPLLFLEEQGYEVTFLPVDKNGLVRPETLRAALRPDTILVSIMMVNNEIGAVEPIEELAKVVHETNPRTLFHVDAIQGFGKLPIYPKRIGVDAMSVSGHKLFGPKGSGFLFVRERVKIRPYLFGGGQQKGMRSGTENVPAIAGLERAVALYLAEAEERREKLYALKEAFVSKVSKLPGAQVFGIFSEENGTPLAERLRRTAPHIVSVGFRGVRSEVLLHALEEKGVYVSSGSACSSNHPAISGTLSGIGVPAEYLDATLRFSFSHENTPEQIDYVISCLSELLPVLGRFRRG